MTVNWCIYPVGASIWRFWCWNKENTVVLSLTTSLALSSSVGVAEGRAVDIIGLVGRLWGADLTPSSPHRLSITMVHNITVILRTSTTSVRNPTTHTTVWPLFNKCSVPPQPGEGFTASIFTGEQRRTCACSYFKSCSHTTSNLFIEKYNIIKNRISIEYW